MLRGMYGAAAGMIAQQQRQEMLTNNLANANTPGYKADQAALRAFPNMLLKAMGTADAVPGRGGSYIGELTTGVYLQERMPNFRQGDLQETGNSTDIALLQGVLPQTESGRPGALFYTVQNENGDLRYTRNGNFTIDGQGFLTTAQGHYVLSTEGQPIRVDNEDFRVAENGTVTNAEGQAVAELNVAYAEDPMLLVKEGNGLLRFEGEGDGLPTAIGNGDISYQLQQRFIERSNVDAAHTMTEMMSAYRSFEANQRILQAYDQSMDKAVNEIGRIG
ncbi:flagellar hook-basal body protein [Halalkalibacter urbisdiaboli]|uniref:flagellar hook-basal body protein n=1 Tax=Halalkalibacter urbisdiaboli TaxID=1960589 RepID=UPI000B43C8B3|nr:flagellar hook-basal body protein [Halalkalibacter urbisdiaboli]